jgi:hypothetical protein
MAREAGDDWDSTLSTDKEFLKRFADLVRADEREACAKVCESEAEMFKSCAYGANDGRYDWKEDGARDSAAAIRARGHT